MSLPNKIIPEKNTLNKQRHIKGGASGVIFSRRVNKLKNISAVYCPPLFAQADGLCM